MAKKENEKQEEEAEVNPEEQKQSKEEIKKEKIEKVLQEEQRIFETIKNIDYKELVSDCYLQMDSCVDMCIENISTGAIIEGSGGTGKTFRTLNKALLKLGEKNIAYTDSFTTDTAFFIWLWKNRNKNLLIVDDCSGFLSSNKILAFLKGALWDINGRRIVHYMTTKPLQDEYGEPVPSTCEINARIIIITNFINKKNPHLQAVLSRVNYCYIDISDEEIISILRQIAEKEYMGLTKDERLEVLNYLIANFSKKMKNLNLRTLFKMFQFKVYSKRCGKPLLWKQLSLNLMEEDDILVLVEELLKNENFKSEEERINEFTALSGRKRATWYRLVQKLESNKKKLMPLIQHQNIEV